MSARTEEDLYVELQYQVLYEDDWFFVVEKPSPLPVHPVGRFKTKNLLSLLQKEYESPADPLRIVNRIDSETSGLVIVAKGQEAARRLGMLWERRKVEKEYEALVMGRLKFDMGSFQQSLGAKIENRYHLTIADDEGDWARTDYQVLKRREEYSWVRIFPKTGRTHQIRAHFSQAEHALVGDKIYIDLKVYDQYVQEGWKSTMLETVKMPRLALHATRLQFIHPWRDEQIEFRSEVPVLFEEFWQS